MAGCTRIKLKPQARKRKVFRTEQSYCDEEGLDTGTEKKEGGVQDSQIPFLLQTRRNTVSPFSHSVDVVLNRDSRLTLFKFLGYRIFQLSKAFLCWLIRAHEMAV